MLSSDNFPSKALMNAFLKTFITVDITSGDGSSKLPESGAFVPKRSLGWLRTMRVRPPTIPCQIKSIGLSVSSVGSKIDHVVEDWLDVAGEAALLRFHLGRNLERAFLERDSGIRLGEIV